MSATLVYDTIVIGGGPGGSTTGAFLARAGQRVLILEKEFFPRFHIGESLLPFGNDVLKASGAWPKVEAGGFMTKLGAEFVTGNSSKFHRFWFNNGLVPGYGQSFQVERSRFDDVLLKHAAECGCDVRQGTMVKTVQIEAGGTEVTFPNGDGAHTARSRWVVDASGRDTFLARTLQWKREPLDLPKRAAVFAHFKGVYRNPGAAAGHITIVRLKGGWFWFIPLDAEKTSVGLVSTLDKLKESGETMQDRFERTVMESSEISQRLRDAQRVGEYFTASDYSYRFNQLATERALLVGDAGGFIDPIFSSGVYIAIKSAQLATGLILRADQSRRGLTTGERARYAREVHRMMGVYFKMISLYYDDASFEVFMNPVSRFKLLAAINSILAGNTRRSFAMWWRFLFFRTVCWIHHRRRIVPRLNFADRAAARATSL